MFYSPHYRSSIMSPHQLIMWSKAVAREPDREDAASDAIEKYWKKREYFASDLASYEYLNKCCRTRYVRQKARQAKLAPIEFAAEIAGDDAERERAKSDGCTGISVSCRLSTGKYWR